MFDVQHFLTNFQDPGILCLGVLKCRLFGGVCSFLSMCRTGLDNHRVLRLELTNHHISGKS